jgi:hypothetical protein
MPLRIDTGDLIDAIESSNDGLGHYLDLQTGDVIPVQLDAFGPGDPEYAETEAVANDEVRYRAIEPISSRDGWRFMRDFAQDVADPDVRERLLDAIHGSGAFGRFKRVLSYHDQLRAAWFRFRDERLLECAREWLASENVDAELVARYAPAPEQ